MPEALEVYSDVFWITLSPYTALFEFAMRGAPARGPAQEERPEEQRGRQKTVAFVRMSPEHAKVLAIVLRRHIQEYERQTGVTIDVPLPILEELRIPPEDWRQFGA